MHAAILWIADMKIEKMYIQNNQDKIIREDGGKQTLPLPWTVREWLQADARILIKAAKAIAEMNEM